MKKTVEQIINELKNDIKVLEAEKEGVTKQLVKLYLIKTQLENALKEEVE